ncbi:MAG: O-antigen ligase family protein [Lachnospiraceae bacterium]|nr:O-antigen ligase family protein [Lachnospiraceae bacterium]
MIENSVVYSFLARFGNAFMGVLQNSFLVNIFLTQNDHNETVTGSVIFKFYRFVRSALVKLFNILRLNKLLDGSIFKVAYIWAGLTVVLAPFLPTMLVLLMSISGFLSLMLRLLCEKDFELQYNGINKYIYIYAGVYLFATFASVTVRGSLFGGLLSICFVLFSIVIINAIESKRQVKILLFLMVCVGVLVALYGFYQYMFQDKFGGVWVDTEMFEGMFRVYSTFANPNVLGEYFLLIIPLAVACFFITKPLIMKLFYLGATGAMLLCLILTYSRGCYIGILVAAAIFLVLLDKRFIFLGFIGLLLMPFVLPETILNRFMSIGNMEDSSTSYRVYIWMGTIAMLKDYWFSGVGPGQAAYNLVYPVYGYNGISAPHAHNTYLQIMCDSGIIGIIAFFVIIYQYFKALFCSYLKEADKTARILTIGAMAAVAGFLVQSLFDYTFYNYRVMLLLWAVIGMGIVFSKYSSLKEV